ncbi:MAG TPA: competence/damage-inducible protein A [Deltaproteobacteria bacterium]|nr:competence/damage-inducible protein A [Deltaproteobacteria bacterium]
MKGEIIAIGNELVSGRIQDTNTFFLAKELARYGFEVRSIKIIPDQEHLIIESLIEASKRSAFAIVTGGLGPTEDDLTAKAASKAFNLPLKRDPVSWEILKAYVEEHHLEMRENVAKMADLPEGAVKLDTKTPRAGFFLEFNKCIFYFLPGIPSETKDLFRKVVLNDLLERIKDRPFVLTKVVKIFGLRESEIENRISDLIPKFEGLSVGYLPCFPEHHLHVTVKGTVRHLIKTVLEDFISKVTERLGEFIYGYDDDTLESVVGHLLREKNLTLSVAESCTGGLIGHRITNVSGSSDYFKLGVVVYSNKAKSQVLNVGEDMLARYGAVSELVARAMGESVKRLGKTDYGIATTGIAGPTGGTPEKPVGTVYICVSSPGGTHVEHHLFKGNRLEIKTMTSQVALDSLRRSLLKMGKT